MEETYIVSKFAWYVQRITMTVFIGILIGFFLGFILCMLNVGHWIDPKGSWDDQFIGWGLILISAVLGWRFSAPVVEGINELAYPLSTKIIYKHKGKQDV